MIKATSWPEGEVTMDLAGCSQMSMVTQLSLTAASDPDRLLRKRLQQKFLSTVSKSRLQVPGSSRLLPEQLDESLSPLEKSSRLWLRKVMKSTAKLDFSEPCVTTGSQEFLLLSKNLSLKKFFLGYPK